MEDTLRAGPVGQGQVTAQGRRTWGDGVLAAACPPPISALLRISEAIWQFRYAGGVTPKPRVRRGMI